LRFSYIDRFEKWVIKHGAAMSFEIRRNEKWDRVLGRKGLAILPTPKLTDILYEKAFMAASEKLVSRANVQLSS
jgi:hypothetical protein